MVRERSSTRSGDRGAEVFEYRLFPWLLGVCAYFAFGLLLTFEALNRGNDFSLMFRGALLALGLWGARMVLRRLTSPRRFIFDAGVVHAEGWWGTVRSWDVSSLSVMGTTLGSWWDNSIAILNDANQRVAFRFWRDLPRYLEMTRRFSAPPA